MPTLEVGTCSLALNAFGVAFGLISQMKKKKKKGVV